MLPDRISNPGPLTYESGALPTALRGPAIHILIYFNLGRSGSAMVPDKLSVPARPTDLKQRCMDL